MARGSAALGAVADLDFKQEDEITSRFDPIRHGIEAALLAEPPTDLRDFAMKVLVLSGEGSWALPDAMILECATLAGRNVDRMPRCLFEKPH